MPVSWGEGNGVLPQPPIYVERDALRARVAELENLKDESLLESELDDKRKEIEQLKDYIREIYRLRGEDPVINAICNKALA